MSRAQMIVGPILNPRPGGTVEFIPEGWIACDDHGTITYIGGARPEQPPLSRWRKAEGLVLPPFLDAHTHIPQFSIRGHFMDGIEGEEPEGRLLAALNRNVFPAEAKCADTNPAEYVVDAFRRDTIAQGVVGGAAYMTVHAAATRIALIRLGPFWSVGMVLMNMNCPAYLRTHEQTLDRDLRELAKLSYPLGGGTDPEFWYPNKLIMTDRFAVCVDTPLRKRAAHLAGELGLRTQAHLNEQLREKELVEKTLYPGYASYTDVYLRDGLLDHRAILAHCVHMTSAEWDILAGTDSSVAHCPTSNALLGSGVMPLNEVLDRGIDYAICTDMAASPTTSMLAEMAQFLKVHAGRCERATPQEALYRATLAPAKILDLDKQLGSFEVGKPLSFIEVKSADSYGSFGSADEAILCGLLDLPPERLATYRERGAYRAAVDELATGRMKTKANLELLDRDVRTTAWRLEGRIARVTIAGEQVWPITT